MQWRNLVVLLCLSRRVWRTSKHTAYTYVHTHKHQPSTYRHGADGNCRHKDTKEQVAECRELCSMEAEDICDTAAYRKTMQPVRTWICDAVACGPPERYGYAAKRFLSKSDFSTKMTSFWGPHLDQETYDWVCMELVCAGRFGQMSLCQRFRMSSQRLAIAPPRRNQLVWVFVLFIIPRQDHPDADD